MSEEEDLAKVFNALDSAWPWRRVEVPQYLIDEFNEETGATLISSAFNVAKGVEVTDDDIRQFLRVPLRVIDYTDHTESAPPKSGILKTRLSDL